MESPRENLGFLRNDAYLLILMVSATDDESTDSSGQPVAVDDVVHAVQALKPSPDTIAVSVLGPPDAPRLRSLRDVDPAAGLQPLCSMSERIPGAPDAFLPACEQAPPPCWTIEAHPACAAAGCGEMPP